MEKRLSHEQWVDVVNEAYGVMCFMGDSLRLRVMRRALLLRPVGAIYREIAWQTYQRMKGART